MLAERGGARSEFSEGLELGVTVVSIYSQRTSMVNLASDKLERDDKKKY